MTEREAPQARRFLGVAGGVLALTLAAQLLAFGRSVVLTPRYGRSSQLDAFNLAMTLATAAASFLTSSVSTILVPELVRRQGVQRTRVFVRWILVLSVVAAALVAIIVAVGARAIAPGLDAPRRWVFILMVATLLLAQPPRVLTAVMSSVAQVRARFLGPKLFALIPVAIPLAFMQAGTSLDVLCAVITASYVSEALLNCGYVWRTGGASLLRGSQWRLDADGALMLRSTVPLLLSSSLFQVQVMFTNTLAGHFGTGMVTFYTNASQLVSIIQGLIVANLMLLLYPRIAAWVDHDLDDAMRRLTAIIGMTNGLIGYVICVFAVAGRQGVAILFQRGRFTAADTRLVWLLTLGIMVTVPFGVMRDFVYRVFYARRNQRTPAMNSIVTVMVTILVIVVLASRFRIWAVVLAVGIGGLYSLCAILWAGRRQGIRLRLAQTLGRLLFWGVLSVLAYAAAGLVPKIDLPIADCLARAAVASLVFAGAGGWLLQRDWRTALSPTAGLA